MRKDLVTLGASGQQWQVEHSSRSACADPIHVVVQLVIAQFAVHRFMPTCAFWDLLCLGHTIQCEFFTGC
jgi:hypothetical protein